ncbi:MAG: YqgQ family protein [Streptococcus sp.]|nr:YqgQ family protein [Streptococcus sp.]
MKTLYDVQQFLKNFGIIIYMGQRLYDIEMMKIELERIYDAGLIDRLDYFEMEAILRREHKLEQKYLEKRGNKE